MLRSRELLRAAGRVSRASPGGRTTSWPGCVARLAARRMASSARSVRGGERPREPAGRRPALPDVPACVLAAHMDVVSRSRARAWSGRPAGACAATATAAGRTRQRRHEGLPGLRDAGDGGRDRRSSCETPLRLAVSTDEEIGCVGVARPAAGGSRRSTAAATPACLVGEPTGMRMVTAHKGKLALRATLHGSARALERRRRSADERGRARRRAGRWRCATVADRADRRRAAATERFADPRLPPSRSVRSTAAAR